MDHSMRRSILNSPLYCIEFKHLGVLGVLEDVLLTRNIDFEYGQEPSRFLCALVRLHVLHPKQPIIQEILLTEHFSYATALAALHVRCCWSPLAVYESLTPLLKNYTPVRISGAASSGFQGEVPLDTLIEFLLKQSHGSLSIVQQPLVLGCLKLPFLAPRRIFQLSGQLRLLSVELEDMLREDDRKSLQGWSSR